MVALGTCAGVWAGEPPPNLARLVAERESREVEARSQYMYQQSVLVEEFGKNGGKVGEYREAREVIFSPGGERTEQSVGQTQNRLARLQMTEEDFRDIREVQPFLFTKELLWLYEVKPRGEEERDGVMCWLLSVKPKQIFEGQRLFEGDLWVDQRDYSIVQSTGRAVPSIFKKGSENLFPMFTTFRGRTEDGHRFPVQTFADDVLPFSTGPLRMRMMIRYANYKRFGASSSVQFGDPVKE
ncbi:MAG TPA: hypothetical protein VFB63_19270 [Bryobacteraceae bacterium]|nr:hypothetical protein [Bryobacteraceae bacterium]